MKILSAALLMLIILSACEITYPQDVNVTVTYNNVPSGIDSSYLLIWKGTNTNQNPLFEDGDFAELNLTELIVDKIPATNGSYTKVLEPDGETIKVAIVLFDTNLAGDLTVSDFYTLPKKPGKATIINVEISIN